MASTLTARGEDGKQSEKIERNTRNAGFCEILLCWKARSFLMFAQGLDGAQSRVVTFVGIEGVCELVIASRLAPTGDRVHNTKPLRELAC
ncbi:Uncharacterised protein [Pseudomonas fluorescens]|uniref:Uncharacterized protein n=1 Tax=Pseudomonas fluorescens TaxID=294 RepID=A0A3S4QQE4_PSEFL|nr:Uncharacterised protein [Pseudomonas fluorescens]